MIGRVIKKMAVHNGVFHSDEVFGVAMMKGLYPGIEVVRTRKEEVLATCDVVADVGEGRYDHHQMDKELREDGIPYCAFGLLWRDFGKDYVTKFCPHLKEEEQETLSKKVADEFIIQIDAGDNGIALNNFESPVTTLSQIVSSYMPLQQETHTVDEAFMEAVAFAEHYLSRLVMRFGEYYKSVYYMEEALQSQPIQETHLLLLTESVKWKDLLLEQDPEGHVWFVVFQDIAGSYRVQTVPKEKDSFEARVDLPVAWGALRDEALSELTGIEDCIFCHPNLFICGNETEEGALKMAALAVEEAKSQGK
ncbi:MAG: MYG1 family protein [Niameybacter sp.]